MMKILNLIDFAIVKKRLFLYKIISNIYIQILNSLWVTWKCWRIKRKYNYFIWSHLKNGSEKSKLWSFWIGELCYLFVILFSSRFVSTIIRPATILLLIAWALLTVFDLTIVNAYIAFATPGVLFFYDMLFQGYYSLSYALCVQQRSS